MPRYNVCYDGKWACYSSIVDDFITPFMALDGYEKWRSKEYGHEKKPLDQNSMNINEAVLGMCINNPNDVRKKAKQLDIEEKIVEAAIKKSMEAQP